MSRILAHLGPRALCIRAFAIVPLALCAMTVAQPAGGALPGAGGVTVAARCDDGASCRMQHLWRVDGRSRAPVRLTSGPERDDNPSISPDGQRIVFDRCPAAGHCRIATVDVAGTIEADLTREPVTHDDESPSFSPDGSRIVFTRTERTGRHLYAMDADGDDVTRLTSGRVQDRGAVYSPDGSSIVFERYERGAGFRIYEIAANARKPSRLSSGPGDYGPDISPDGSRIVFARRAGAGSAIWVMEATGRGGRALTAPRAWRSDAQPAFSPDGSQIVFDRLRGRPPAGQSLMVMDATGRGERALTPTSDFFSNADWRSLRPARAGRR